MIYDKTPTTISEQIIQLQSRGLLIPDLANVEHCLTNISYYRLAGYWWPLQADKVTHIFKPDSSFDTVIALYNFDRELRLLLFDVIERIEIGLRTRLIYELSHEKDPWWFTDPLLFIDSLEWAKTLSGISAEVSRSKDTFIVEHTKRYAADKRFPPAWKTLETVTFGNLSKLYGNLKPTVKSKDRISAGLMTVNHTFLPSWLQTIAQIRNICAHHGRLWNKNLPGRPKLLPKPPAPWLNWVPPVHQHQFLYIHICCMKYLLNVIDAENRFTTRMANLLTRYPNVDLNALGFPTTWQTEPLWQH